MKAYQARWAEVDALVTKERQAASLELRWKQMNSIFALAIRLGLVVKNDLETEEIHTWAKLKEKYQNQSLQK